MYDKGGVETWRDLIATAGLVRGMLGISASAWDAARAAMGEQGAAIVVAGILQRAEAIKSPGGYLRGLTERSRAGEFSAWPMMMALAPRSVAPSRNPDSGRALTRGWERSCWHRSAVASSCDGSGSDWFRHVDDLVAKAIRLDLVLLLSLAFDHVGIRNTHLAASVVRGAARAWLSYQPP